MQYEVYKFDKMREANWIKLSSQFQICEDLYTDLEEAKGLVLTLIGKGYKVSKTRTEHLISFPEQVMLSEEEIPQAFVYEYLLGLVSAS